MDRTDILTHYRQAPDIDVLVAGGGINGIGTFRDLALQGARVLLVDRADFCSGASAAATRMAHGGLRYLENGEFRLVRESLTERNRLLRNAPHAVEPMPYVIPLFSYLSGILNAPLKFLGLLQRPSERGVIVVKLGLMLYDWFTRHGRATPTHRMLSRAEALAQHPGLNPHIVAAASYYDALMPQAERIGLELVLDAEAASGSAHALNYVSVAGIDGGQVTLRDEVTGETFAVRPRVLVNAGGAWIDRVNRALGRDTHYIGGTKGSHAVWDSDVLNRAMNGATLFFENPDGRLTVLAPFRGKAIVGTTDIRTDDPDAAVCTDDEIDYFVGFTQRALPGVVLDRKDIVFTFSGVRPLPSTDVGYAGLISRDHSIHELPPDAETPFPILSLVGGKWTTFRAFAEQTTDRILPTLGLRRRARTEDLPIGGGVGYPRGETARARWLESLRASTGLPAGRVDALFERYGTRADAVARYLIAGDDRPLAGAPAFSAREIRFIAEREKVTRLEDIILRRTLLALLGHVNGEALRDAAHIAGDALGWPPERVQQEVRRTTDMLVRGHGVAPERLA